MTAWTGRAARLLLGATAHPGGTALTRHGLALLDPAPGAVVVDAGCGAGATLRLLAARGQPAVGVDVDPAAVRAARRRGGRVVAGDLRAAPLRAGAATGGALCECVLSTLRAPDAGAAALARLLAPGTRLVLSDVVREDGLDPDVARVVDGLTGAQPAAAYPAVLEAAGLAVARAEDRREDALALVRRLRRRLAPWPAARRVAAAAEAEVRAGRLGYLLLVAHAPR